eukprot:15206819-Alexandrium_andersonii.AAC.1
MADCPFWRIGALTGLGRIADRTLGTLRCEDARVRVHASSHSMRKPTVACRLQAGQRGRGRACAACRLQ